MAGAKPVGTMIVEFDLDATKYTRKQKEILAMAQQNSTDVEKTFKSLGITTDKMYDAQRQAATNAYNAITQSAKTSAGERQRAEEAYHKRIEDLARQQHGTQTSLIDKIKANWIAASVAITAAFMAAQKAMQYMELGAKEQQVVSSFQIVAEQSGIMADTLIENMKRATRETIDDSDLMQKATKLMLKGFDAAQIERFSEQVITASRYAGINAAEAFDRLGDSIANKMPKAMVQLGAVTRDQMKLVQAAIKEGADEASLFELAMLNLEGMALKMQGTMDDAAISIQQFHAQLTQTKETIGGFLIAALQKLYAMFQANASIILSATACVYEFISAMAKLAAWGAEKLGLSKLAASFKGFANEMIYEAQRVTKEAEDMKKKSIANFYGTTEEGKKATEAQIKQNDDAVKAMLKKLKAFADLEKGAKQAARELEKFNDVMRNLEYEKSVVETFGLDELKKQLIENAAWADKLKDSMKDQPTERRTRVNALIDEIKVLKDLRAEWENWQKLKDKADKEDMERIDKEVAEMKRVKDAFESLALSIDPVAKAAKELADNFATINEYANMFPDLAGNVQPLIDAVQSAFDAEKTAQAATYYDSLMGYEDKWYSYKIKNLKDIYEKEKKLFGEGPAYQKFIQEKIKVDKTWTEKKTEGIGDVLKSGQVLFGTLANLYEEDTKAHKNLDAVSAAFAIAEQARLTILAIYNAVVAIATQGSGDPYSAFARIAAMAVAMGALLSTIGASIGGGGSSGGTESVPEPYKPSTVLAGESGEASESIVNALELLRDVNANEYVQLVGIHSNMIELNSNLTGMARTILQSTDKGHFKEQLAIGGGSLEELMTDIYAIFSKGSIAKALEDLTSGKGTPVDETTKMFLQNIYGGITKGLLEIGSILGVDAATILAYQFEAQVIKLRGVKREDIEEAIMAWVGKISDIAAKDLFGEIISQYQQLDEGLFETAIRIVRDIAVVRDALEMMGQSFTGNIAALIEFTEYMVEMAGDLETLQEYFTTYYESFMTEAEQQAYMTKQLTELLKQQGMTLPQTREGYAALVESLDLTTEAGQKAYIILMQLAEMAGSYYSLLEQEANDALEKAEERLKKTFDAEKERIQKQYDEEMKALNERLTDARAAVSTLTAAITQLNSSKQTLIGTVQSYGRVARAEAQSTITDLLNQARRGNFEGMKEGLTGAIKILTSQESKNTFGSYTDYMREQMRTYAQLDEMGRLADEQLTDAEKTVSILEAQKNELTDWRNAQLKALDDQLNAILGIDTTVLSIEQAIREYKEAYDRVNPPTPEVPLPIVPPVPPGPEPITDRATRLLTEGGHPNPSEKELEWINTIIAGGRSDDYIRERIRMHPGRFQSGGYHAGGWRMVGEQGPELEYTGPSLIYSNPQSKSMTMNAELVAEIRALRKELNMQNFQIVKNTSKTSKLLDRWDGDGMPAERTTA